MLHLETSIIYLQLWRSREAEKAIGKRGEEIHDHLGHCAEVCMLPLLHGFRVKRVSLNLTSKTGAIGHGRVWLKRICSKSFRQQNDREV